MPCIGIFGRKNCGKSSLVNILSGTKVTEVTNTSGTTKEPSKHLMNIDGIGEVLLVDTSGIDDYGNAAGGKRVLMTLAY